MSLTAREIARAAVATTAAQFERNGFRKELRDLDELLLAAARERSASVQLTITTPSGDIGPFAERIAEAIEKKLGRRVDVRQKADPYLLGGAVVRYGDERMDFSLRGALDNAEARLIAFAEPSPLPS